MQKGTRSLSYDTTFFIYNILCLLSAEFVKNISQTCGTFGIMAKSCLFKCGIVILKTMLICFIIDCGISCIFRTRIHYSKERNKQHIENTEIRLFYKRGAYYGPRSGFLYYIRTTPRAVVSFIRHLITRRGALVTELP